MASSSSLTLTRSWLYQVFVSFRGADVRKGFLSHLLEQLKSKDITVFIDEEMERGELIDAELVGAIRFSRVAIVLLSPDYASSSWCLDELVEIMKCMKENKKKVIPIFYKVDPSHVSDLTRDFGKVFDETCVGKSKLVTEKWRKALEDVGVLTGYDSESSLWQNEAEMIKKIAANLTAVLGLTPSTEFDYLVGMETRIAEINSLFNLQSDEVKIIGIVGPSGIGKTTTARVLYNQLSPGFPFSTFLENIRGSYEKPCGNDYQLKLRFQKNLLSEILNQKDIEVRHLGVAQEKLGDKKVLAVFDEVDSWWQLEEMANQRGWFGPGSILIITTEDIKLLNALGLGIDHIYVMKFPTRDESLQIFCQYAFGKKSPDAGFEELALEVTWLAGKLPLGLRVMGSYLRGMSREEWIEALPRLRSTLDTEIESTLRFTYDGLSDEDQALFLHIACFFAGFEVDRFKMCLANSHLEVNHSLQVLVHKYLISTNKGYIEMQSFLQLMGREIVMKQCLQKPGKRQFLMDTDDISYVLEDDTGTRKILGISLFNSASKEIQISKGAFDGMNNLQFLKVDSINVRIPDGLNCLPGKLRLIDWPRCPLEFWPSKFSAKFLVELFMPFSSFETLWEGIQPLQCLKLVDLSESPYLKETPNLSKATSLEKLNLHGCKNIKAFPNVSDSIVELGLCSTGIKEVPPWIENLFRLPKLVMTRCEKLKDISTNISKLENLEFLALSFCDFSEHDAEEIDLYKDPESFEAIIEWGPDFKRCWKLRSDINIHIILPICLPDKALTSLISLRFRSNGFKTIPGCIRSLTGLSKLDVTECRNLVALPPLPESLLFLDAQGCESLKSIESSFQNPNICLNFAKCFNLDQKARKLIQTSACKYALLPGKKMSAHFTDQASSDFLTISLTPTPLPSSLRFKSCILLSKGKIYSGGDDIEMSANSLMGVSCHVRGKHNGFTVRRRSIKFHMPALDGCRNHLYIFEDSFSLNQDCSEAEETIFNELSFVFIVEDKKWKVKGCGVRLLEEVPRCTPDEKETQNKECMGVRIEANNGHASGEDEEKEEDDDGDGEGDEGGADGIDAEDEGVDGEEDIGGNDAGFSNAGIDINREANNETEGEKKKRTKEKETEEGEGEESGRDEDAETRSRK